MIRSYIKNIFTSYSFLVLNKNQIFGAILFLLTLFNPSSAILSLVAFISLLLLGRLVGLSSLQLLNEMYTYNSLLVGMSIGSLFQVTFLSVVFTITASFFTLLLSIAFNSLFSYYFRLPVLNLPFTITASMVYLSSIRYGNLYITNTLKHSELNFDSLPIWLSGLFKATGVILFLPYDFIGLVVLLSMLFFSRINFLLTISGYYCGTLLLTLLKGSSYSAFTDLYSFNFILISLALGGLFLIPSIKSYIIAISGVLVSVFVLDAVDILWSSYGIPAFAFPFVIVVLLVLYVLIINRFPLVTTTYLNSPEHNLEHYLDYTSRFNQNLPQPHLPFSGEWTIYQPFFGEWTHKGVWAYGIDFLITDSEGKSFRREGRVLEDYYSYNKPVLSPVSGRVIDIWNECLDNSPGIVDEQNNWGNYCIIYSDWGYYVELSHFSPGSITIKAGDYVVQGQYIGKCGNSGYSPQPHLHMQCQSMAHIGAPTIPFTLTNCIIDSRCYFGSKLNLKKDMKIRSVQRSRNLERKLQFNLDDSFKYNLIYNKKKQKTVLITVMMASDGSYYLSCNDGGNLYFSNREGMFSFYRFEGNLSSALRYIFQALPRMPLTDEKIEWTDNVNSSLVDQWSNIFSFLKSFNHTAFRATGVYSLQDKQTISGRISLRSKVVDTMVKLGEVKGIDIVRVCHRNNEYELQLVS